MGPIGVLDSGAGGLTVLARLAELMPRQPFIYYGDAAFCPYGARPQEEILARVVFLVEELLQAGCPMIVLACNTATSVAIGHLRQVYPQPFVGMEPAVKPAALRSATGHVGVLATDTTLHGDSFHRALALYSPRATIHYAPGKGLVELVEAGSYEGDETTALVRARVEPLLELGIDHLVLGCTHYPFLLRAFQEVLPPAVRLLDPAPAVARQALRVYRDLGAESAPPARPWIEFRSSGETQALARHFAYYVHLIGLQLAHEIRFE